MTSLGFLGWGAVLLAAGAVGSLVVSRRRRAAGWVSTVAVAGFAVCALSAAAGAFLRDEAEVSLLKFDGLGASLTLGLDALSALFLVIVAIVALCATLYSVDYMTHFTRDGVAKFYPVLLVFFASVCGVLAARDVLFFLVFWEIMTLTSFFLVVFERENPRAQRAGLKYFVITHAATLCLVGAALILWDRSGSFAFGAMREALQGLVAQSPLLGHLVVLLLFLGFATKAGVLPMGDWLPDAHPVAPSGMSAVLSGALVKLGIYGLIRTLGWISSVPEALEIWGAVLALAGTGSLFVGTLMALKQADSKRLMAFHTIGQIGYVCLGLGVGLYCLPEHPVLAVLALCGGLLHALNHACFKACLFLGAGAVLYRTGERDMDRLGGLAASMPVTATSSTIAALAIAGVPPLNGFASKWLIVATCLLAGMQYPLFLLLALVALFVSLATLASFVKVIGAVFLGPERTGEPALEVPPSMAAAQAVLALLCVLLGLAPVWALRVVRAAVAAVVPAVPSAAELFGGATGLVLGMGGVVQAAWSPVAVVAALPLLVALGLFLQHAGASKVRQVEVWHCGEEHSPAEARYPASSFYLPFKHAFNRIYPTLRARPPRFPAVLRRSFDVDSWLFYPFARAVERGSEGLSRSHVGTPQVYLLWVVAGAVAVVAIVLALVR